MECPAGRFPGAALNPAGMSPFAFAGAFSLCMRLPPHVTLRRSSPHNDFLGFKYCCSPDPVPLGPCRNGDMRIACSDGIFLEKLLFCDATKIFICLKVMLDTNQVFGDYILRSRIHFI
jgi:hypothetical protein